jgi:chromosome transmission fidelity protein 1
LSCAHVIPKSNLLTQVICRGPRKQDFEFKFASRSDDMLVRCVRRLDDGANRSLPT